MHQRIVSQRVGSEPLKGILASNKKTGLFKVEAWPIRIHPYREATKETCSLRAPKIRIKETRTKAKTTAFEESKPACPHIELPRTAKFRRVKKLVNGSGLEARSGTDQTMRVQITILCLSFGHIPRLLMGSRTRSETFALGKAKERCNQTARTKLQAYPN